MSGLTYGFSTTNPVCVVSATRNTGASGTVGNHIPQADATDTDTIKVRFYNVDGTNDELDQVTTEDDQMDFNIIILGIYST